MAGAFSRLIMERIPELRGDSKDADVVLSRTLGAYGFAAKWKLTCPFESL